MMRLTRRSLFFITVLIVILQSGFLYAADLTPEETVTGFYNSIQSGEYEKAYDFISQKMKDGKNCKEWAADWKKTVDFGQVVLIEFGVESAKIEGDKATVRAWNKSSAIFNKDGIVEHETDHLEIEDGIWKLDVTDVDLPDF